MNFGTKVRTIARIVASLNTAVYAVNAAVVGLGFGWLTLAWTIATIVVDFAVAFSSHTITMIILRLHVRKLAK
jgi:hypothetical protein